MTPVRAKLEKMREQVEIVRRTPDKWARPIRAIEQSATLEVLARDVAPFADSQFGKLYFGSMRGIVDDCKSLHPPISIPLEVTLDRIQEKIESVLHAIPPEGQVS